MQGLKKSSASWERKFPRATFLANPWPYSSFNLAEMVLNPTLTPSTHSKIHPIKYQASNIEHCMINKNCRYIWSKLKLSKSRNYPEIGWVKKGLYRAQFTNVKFAVHDKRHQKVSWLIFRYQNCKLNSQRLSKISKLGKMRFISE